MTITSATMLTVKTAVNIPVEKAWTYWTEPQHITQWNAASDDWHTPKAENNLTVGGRFVSRMEAKDGSFGFDFGGTYTKIEMYRLIEYILDDNRKVSVKFNQEGSTTQITEEFEAENQNPPEMQQAGWQAIMDNFRKYAKRLGSE